ncbi:MAG: NAD(P)/FAD-dependent oxidoreductase, partial [Candidatus Sumerlaeia bacterium]|nr:NAD(P)/FAD-dependent oxidoreductase [Candidatus Sumerlaeia bacterium]
MKTVWDVIVVGGGPAGMMAAGTSASRGKRVLLLEKNEKLGKKLFLTGKGRCNITNFSAIETFIENVTRNGKFLYSAFSAFSNLDLMNFFEQLGVKLKVEQGKRVFPASDKSSDIIKALIKFLRQNNVQIKLNARVTEILAENRIVQGVKLQDGTIILGKKVILATGGMSYPETGSTGDGYEFASKLGHTIIPPEPSLVPVETTENWVRELQGLALKNVSAALIVDDKKIHSEFGEMLFTHFGVSGPIILTLSTVIKKFLAQKIPVFLSIDLKPALSEKILDVRLQRDFARYSRRQFKNALGDLLPTKLIPIIIKLSGIEPTKFVHQLTRAERHKLLHLLKDFRLTVKCLRPLAEAIITSGGVSVNEIDSTTMQSKLITGLYFAGEIIDVDALTGG